MLPCLSVPTAAHKATAVQSVRGSTGQNTKLSEKRKRLDILQRRLSVGEESQRRVSIGSTTYTPGSLSPTTQMNYAGSFLNQLPGRMSLTARTLRYRSASCLISFCSHFTHKDRLLAEHQAASQTVAIQLQALCHTAALSNKISSL